MLLMMMMLLVFHKRGHHHHRLLLMTVAAELADVRRRSGRRWNGRTGFIPAATAIAAAATAAAAHVVAVAIVAKTTVNAAVSTGTTFRFLHKATPFSSGILEPNLEDALGEGGLLRELFEVLGIRIVIGGKIGLEHAQLVVLERRS